MVSPIYDLNPSLGITKVSIPGSANSTLDSGAVNGMEPERITVAPDMGERSAPKNPPATWSSGPDNNDYLAKE